MNKFFSPSPPKVFVFIALLALGALSIVYQLGCGWSECNPFIMFFAQFLSPAWLIMVIVAFLKALPLPVPGLLPAMVAFVFFQLLYSYAMGCLVVEAYTKHLKHKNKGKKR